MTKLSLKEKFWYSFGSLGMGVTGVMHMLFLTWFFIHDKGTDIPYFIEQGYVIDWGWFGLTVMGLLLALRTIFDAVSDAIIANMSDKLKLKKGTRTTLIKWSAIPFAVTGLMVFFLPDQFISTNNIVWIAISLILNTMLLTIYSINHEALMAKITKTSEERIDLGTMASAAWFIGFVVVSGITSIWGFLESSYGMSLLTAIRVTFGFSTILGAIFLIIPGLLIDEKKFEDNQEIERPKVKVFKALRTVMRYKNYRKFIFANTAYTASTFIFESGLIFFVTILAVLDKSLLGILTIVIGAITVAMYPLINKLAKSKGRKFVLMASFVSYFVTFGVLTFMNPNPSPWVYLSIILVVAPFSQAGFGILPVVIASDNADYMKKHTGIDMTAMHMGVSGFFRKLGATVAMVLFPSFLVLGKEVGADIGIRYAVIFAAILSLIGFLIMRGYDEKEVMKYNK